MHAALLAMKRKPDDSRMACRRDHRPQLQPVPGGDLLDRIRSEIMLWFLGASCALKPSVLFTRDLDMHIPTLFVLASLVL